MKARLDAFDYIMAKRVERNERRGGLESLPLIGNIFLNRRLDSEAAEIAGAHGEYLRIKEILSELRDGESYSEREQVLQRALKEDVDNTDLYNKILRAEYVGASLKNEVDPENRQLLFNNVLNRNIANDPVFLDSLLDLIEADDELSTFTDLLKQRIEESGNHLQIPSEAEGSEDSFEAPVEQETRDLGELLKRTYSAILEPKGKERFFRFVKEYEMDSLPPGSKIEFEDHVEGFKNERARLARGLKEGISGDSTELSYYTDWLSSLSRAEYSVDGDVMTIPLDMQELLYKQLAARLTALETSDERGKAEKGRVMAAYKNFQNRLLAAKKTNDRYYKIVNNFSIIPLAKESETEKRLEVIEGLLKTIKSNDSLTEESKKRLANIFDNWIKYYHVRKDEEELKKLEFSFEPETESGEESGGLPEFDIFDSGGTAASGDSEAFAEALPDEEGLGTLPEDEFSSLTPEWDSSVPFASKPATLEDEVPELAFLSTIRDEYNTNGRIENLSERIKKLDEDSGGKVMVAMAADPELSEYYEEIEDTLYKYNNIWGRALGMIGRKVKNIEERLGRAKSELYLEELLNRTIVQLGESHYVVRALRNMLDNLKKSHEVQAPKLDRFKERLAGKSLEEQVKEIGRMARDPYYSSILGHLQRTARNIVNSDDFFNIFDPSHMPHDSVSFLQEIFYDSLPSLRKYEPDVANRLEISLSLMDNQLEEAAEELPEIGDDLMASIEHCEEDETMEALKAFAAEVAELPTLEEIYAELEQETEGLPDVEPGELVSRQRRLEERAATLRAVYSEDQPQASEVSEALDDVSARIERGIARTELSNKLKNSSDLEEVLTESFDGELFDGDESFGLLGETLARNFIPPKARDALLATVADGLPEGEEQSRVKELTALLERIEQEVTPLPTVESRVKRLEFWKANDYKDSPHLVQFISKYIKEYFILNSREGGLMQIILTGLNEKESKEEKLDFLRECLENPLYQHIASTISTIIENVEKGISFDCSDVSEEWIMEQIDGFLPDAKGAINWLRALKYQEDCEAYRGFIDDRLAFLNERLSEQVHKESLVSYKKTHPQRVEIHKNIITLTQAVLKLEGKSERQSYVLEQEMRYKVDRKIRKENIFHMERRALYHLISTASDEPEARVMALVGKRGLSSRERNRYLELLKKVRYSGGTLSLAGELGIGADEMAYGAVKLFIDDKESLQAKLLELDELKGNDEHEQYRADFEIEPRHIERVVDELKEQAQPGAVKSAVEGKKGRKELKIYSPEETVDFVADYLGREGTTSKQKFVLDQERLAPDVAKLFAWQRRALFYLAPGDSAEQRLIANIVRRARSSFGEKWGLMLALNRLVESEVDELKERILLELADFGVKSSLIRAAAVRLWLATFAFSSESKSLESAKVEYFRGLPISEALHVKESDIEEVLPSLVEGERLFAPPVEGGYLPLEPTVESYEEFARRLQGMKGRYKISRMKLLKAAGGNEELLEAVFRELGLFKSVAADVLEIEGADKADWNEAVKSLYGVLFRSPEEAGDKELFKNEIQPLIEGLFKSFEENKKSLLTLAKSTFDSKYKYDFSITGADINSMADKLKSLKGAELPSGVETAGESGEVPEGGSEEVAVEMVEAVKSGDTPEESGAVESELTDESEGGLEQPAGVLDESASNLDISSDNLDVSSDNLDMSSDNLDVSSDNLDMSSDNLDMSSDNLDVSSGNLDMSSDNLDELFAGIDSVDNKTEESIVDAADESTDFLKSLLTEAEESGTEDEPVFEEVSAAPAEISELLSTPVEEIDDSFDLLSALDDSGDGVEDDFSISTDSIMEEIKAEEAKVELETTVEPESDVHLASLDEELEAAGIGREPEQVKASRVVTEAEAVETPELSEANEAAEVAEVVEAAEVAEEVGELESGEEATVEQLAGENAEAAVPESDKKEEPAKETEKDELIPDPFRNRVEEMTYFAPLFKTFGEVVKSKKNKLDPSVYTTILQMDIIKQLESEKELFTFVDKGDVLWGISYKELFQVVMDKDSKLNKENKKLIADKLSKTLSAFPLNKLYSDQVYKIFALDFGSNNNSIMLKRFVKQIDSWRNAGQPKQQSSASPLDFLADTLNIGALLESREKSKAQKKKSPPKKQPKKPVQKEKKKAPPKREQARKSPTRETRERKSQPKKDNSKPVSEVVQKSFRDLDTKLTNYLVKLFKSASGPQLEFLKKRYLEGDKETVKSYLWGVAKGSIKTRGVDVQSLFTNYWDSISFNREKVVKMYQKKKK